jgi:hypothetical protein
MVYSLNSKLAIAMNVQAYKLQDVYKFNDDDSYEPEDLQMGEEELDAF